MDSLFSCLVPLSNFVLILHHYVEIYDRLRETPDRVKKNVHTPVSSPVEFPRGWILTMKRMALELSSVWRMYAIYTQKEGMFTELERPRFCNDNIIDLYGHYLNTHIADDDAVFLHTLFVPTKKIRRLPESAYGKDLTRGDVRVIIPVNYYGSHWNVWAVDRTNDRITIYDSLYRDPVDAKTLNVLVEKLQLDNVRVGVHATTKRQESAACGYYALYFAERLLRNKDYSMDDDFPDEKVIRRYIEHVFCAITETTGLLPIEDINLL